jgi:hypothetical protein
MSFDPKWGGPEKVIFDQLVGWTTRPEPCIKFYSGTAIYRKEFNLGQSASYPWKRRNNYLHKRR